MKRLFFPLFLFLISLFFFWQFFLKGFLPIPADTIVGLYHPWRDFYVQDYPNGIPFKNFLITDPVRQQYVWRYLAIEQIKNKQLPLWNPYNFSGNPLLANFQTAIFYPLNIFFLILPFDLAWSLLVMFQPLLMAFFLYLYLRNLKLNQWASLVGGLVFAFSGFSIAWLEWNTIGQTALWLPLILFSMDKIICHPEASAEVPPKAGSRFGGRSRRIIWSLIFIFSLISSFFAGHLQVFSYIFLFSFVYLILRWWQNSKRKKTALLFIICYLLFTIITAVQWLPTLQFINLSARGFDLPNWQISSWFLPWQNLVQFISPDFFGNPATLNYFGEWNYGEFVGYMGILPLLFALLAILWRRDRKTWLATFAVLVSLAFMLPTPLAKLPYQLSIPFLSTLQPTRLMVIVDFCLAVLAALGVDYFIKRLHDTYHVSKLIKPFLLFGIVLLGIWVFLWGGFNGISKENLGVAQRNLILPTVLFVVSVLSMILLYYLRQKRLFTTIIYIIIVGIVCFDLFRFGWKFTPFIDAKFLFPQTETIKFLQNQPKPFRIMATDNRILPPNLSTFYYLEDISGYDPLYLKSYGELIAAWYRNKPDISPFSFNRILTPQDYPSKMADLLNVKYVLSLKDEVSPKLKLVFQEGQTRIYENKNVLPRAFFVEEIKWGKTKQEAIEAMFDKDFNPLKTAIIEKPDYLTAEDSQELCQPGNVKIIEYEQNKIVLKVNCHWKNSNAGFLVLSNMFYPTWKVKVYSPNNHYYWDNHIYKTDYGLMGVFVPWEGENIVEFTHQLLPEFPYTGNL